MRCFEGRVYDIERGAWVACERCSGSGRVMVYLYPNTTVVNSKALWHHALFDDQGGDDAKNGGPEDG
jgi:hypothetical protein